MILLPHTILQVESWAQGAPSSSIRTSRSEFVEDWRVNADRIESALLKRRLEKNDSASLPPLLVSIPSLELRHAADLNDRNPLHDDRGVESIVGEKEGAIDAWLIRY